MADEFNVYRDWLGLPDETHVDHYTLLSLPPFESGEAKIALAAQRAATKVRSFRPGPRAREWSRLLDDIQEAKNCLLDRSRKAAYDRKLRGDETSPPEIPAPYSSVAVPGSAFAPPNSDLYPPAAKPVSRIASELLPAARDPSHDAANDDVSDPPSSADDPAELPMAYLVDHHAAAPNATDAYIAAPSAPRAAPSLLYATGGLDPMEPVAIPSIDQPAPVPATTYSAPPPAKPRSLSAEHLLVLGILGTSLLVIGLGVFIALKRQQTAAAVVTPEPSPQRQTVTIETTKPAKPPADARPAPAAASVAPAPKSAQLPEPAPPITPPAPPQVTRAEVLALVTALKAAKQALGDQDFSAVAAHLASAESLATLPSHQAAVTRLTAVSGYVERFHSAITAALREMQAGESFTVGASTEVAFVEASNRQVTLHLGGMNRTYDLNDLPVGLAMALADFKLQGGTPMSRVIKGAYLLVHKRSDEELREKARLWWHEAQSRGLEMSQLLPFLNDDYDALVNDAPDKIEKN